MDNNNIKQEQENSELTRIKTWNKWFFDRVRFMRSCQKDYFKARREQRPREECEALKRRSMAVEKEVDDEIERLEKGLEAREARKRFEENKQLLIEGFDCIQQ